MTDSSCSRLILSINDQYAQLQRCEGSSEEDERKMRRKEKNKVAAQRSRKRQIERADELHEACMCLEQRNLQLRREVASLSLEQRHLLEVLQGHEPCCPITHCSPSQGTGPGDASEPHWPWAAHRRTDPGDQDTGPWPPEPRSSLGGVTGLKTSHFQTSLDLLNASEPHFLLWVCWLTKCGWPWLNSRGLLLLYQKHTPLWPVVQPLLVTVVSHFLHAHLCQ